jgi:hypothetical protein
MWDVTIAAPVYIYWVLSFAFLRYYLLLELRTGRKVRAIRLQYMKKLEDTELNKRRALLSITEKLHFNNRLYSKLKHLLQWKSWLVIIAFGLSVFVLYEGRRHFDVKPT